MTHFSIRMPAVWQEKFNAIAQSSEAFYNEHLSYQNRQLSSWVKDGA